MGEVGDLVQAIVRADGEKNRALGGVVAEGAGRHIWTSELLHAQQTDVGSVVEIVGAHVLIPNVVKSILAHGERRTLALQLEDDQTAVVSRSKQVEIGMRGQDPEPVVFSPERLNRGPLREIPHAHGLVLSTRDDQLMLGMEERARNVVEMASARVDLPGLRLAHPPYFDDAVVGSGDDQRKRGVEHGIVDAPVVALQNVLDGREAVEGLKIARASTARSLVLLPAVGRLAQSRDVPDSNGLIHRCGYDEVLLGVELGGHDVV